mgnify:CR=1 FL=1
MSNSREYVDRINAAMAIALPDGRVLTIRWKTSIDSRQMLTIEASFYVRDSIGFVGGCDEKEL